MASRLAKTASARRRRLEVGRGRLGGPARLALVRGDQGEPADVVAAGVGEVEPERLGRPAVEQPAAGQAGRLVGRVAQPAVAEVVADRTARPIPGSRGRCPAASAPRARRPSPPRTGRWPARTVGEVERPADDRRRRQHLGRPSRRPTRSARAAAPGRRAARRPRRPRRCASASTTWSGSPSDSATSGSMKAVGRSHAERARAAATIAAIAARSSRPSETRDDAPGSGQVVGGREAVGGQVLAAPGQRAAGRAASQAAREVGHGLAGRTRRRGGGRRSRRRPGAGPRGECGERVGDGLEQADPRARAVGGRRARAAPRSDGGRSTSRPISQRAAVVERRQPCRRRPARPSPARSSSAIGP